MGLWNRYASEERASVNGIDITRYAFLPRETVWAILDAVEDGCPQWLIDRMADQDPPALLRYLEWHREDEDIQAFAERLAGGGKANGKLLDMREQIQVWDMILPEDSYLGWSSEYIRFSRDKLQRYIDTNEPFPGSDTPFLFAAGRIADGEIGNFLNMANEESERFFGKPGEPHGIKTAEYICCYLVLSGLPLKEGLAAGGKAAADLGLDRHGIYKCMLEAAAVAAAITDGILAAQTFYRDHETPVRYRVTETGFLKKRLITERIPDKGRLFLILSEALKKPMDALDILMSAGAGHAEIVLWCAAFARDCRSSQELAEFVDSEKLRYSGELYRYILHAGGNVRKKEVRNNDV